MFTIHMPEESLSNLRQAWQGGTPAGRASLEWALGMVTRRLREDPVGLGESRGGDSDRVVFGHGLGVAFEVDLPARLVRVRRAWEVRRAS